MMNILIFKFLSLCLNYIDLLENFYLGQINKMKLLHLLYLVDEINSFENVKRERRIAKEKT